MPPTRARVLDRWSVLLLAAASAYVALTLSLAIARTEIIEQDAAYYCVVTERFVAGEGLTSLCDRRGPADGTLIPAPLSAGNVWPVVLAPLVAITGEARYTGSLISLLGLIAALWLGAVAVGRATGAKPVVAALCVAAALLHRRACSAAVLPLSDGASLGATAAVMLAIVSRRPWVALLLAGLAVAIRFQNAVLALPLLWLIPDPGLRRRAVIAGLAAAAVAVAWRGGWQVAEGVLVFLDPTHRDSLFRALRFLFVPLVIGLVLSRRRPEVAPFWLLFLGHVLVLLAYHDPTDARGWLFANRHGLPFHLTAGAMAALAIARLRGWPRLLVLGLVCVAAVENGRRPWQKLESTLEETGRPEMVLALEYLRREPLPDDAIVLCHDCDVLALELGIRGVHLRGHEPGAIPELHDYLLRRGITHVLLAWGASRHVAERNRRMDAFERELEGSCDLIADLRADGGPVRALLLAVRQ